MWTRTFAACALLALPCMASANAPAEPAKNAAPAGYDASLAASLGADARGMRQFVLSS